MATKKPQALRTNDSMPTWVWLVLAVMSMAVALFALAPNLFSGMLNQEGDGFLRAVAPQFQSPLPVPIDDSAGNENQAQNESEAAVDAGGYDFYTVLQTEAVRLSDAELAAIGRAEQQRSGRALPIPIQEHQHSQNLLLPVTATLPRNLALPESEPVLRPETSGTAPTSSRYILQTRAFSNHSDAETTRVSLAMMGLLAHIEKSLSTEGTERYQLRLGPYHSIDELQQAKYRLEQNGLAVMTVRIP